MTKSDLASDSKKPAEMTGSCLCRVTNRNVEDKLGQTLKNFSSLSEKIGKAFVPAVERWQESFEAINNSSTLKQFNNTIGVDMMKIRLL